MQAYLDLMREALENGAVKIDRTGTGVRSLFGRQLRFDLAQAFRSSPPRGCISNRSCASSSGF